MCGGCGRPSTKVISGRKQHAHELVDDKAHERLHAVFVLGPHHEIEGDGLFVVHEIADLEIRAGDVLGDKRIAVERKERHRGREHRTPLLVGAVHHIAGRARNRMVGLAALAPAVCDHLEIELLDAPVGVGKGGGHIGQRPGLAFGLLLIEHVQKRAREKRVARFGPVIDKALAVRVHEDGDEVLHVAHLVDGAKPDLLRAG